MMRIIKPLLFNLRYRGSTVVTDIYLRMIGTEQEDSIPILANGESSDHYTFILDRSKGINIDSWGDYFGTYTQEGESKEIIILNYDHNLRSNLRIEINETSYTPIYP